MRWRWLAIFVFISTPLLQVEAGPYSSGGAKKSSEVLHTFAKKALQGFSMKVWISNQMTTGQEAWDPPQRPWPVGYGLEYPESSGIEHLVGLGPWIGGIINGRRYVSEGYNGNTAGKYFVPEVNAVFYHTSTLNTNEPNKRGFDDDNDGKIDEDDLDGTDNDGDWNPLTDDVGADGLPDSLEVGCKGAYNALTNPDPAQDNYDPTRFNECVANRPQKNIPAIYTERNGRSDHGEPNVDEDYAAVSESDYYCAAEDSFPQTDHVPMGIKVIQKSYAWESPYGEAILPFEYYFINVGNNIIRDVVIGFFADMDVGPVSSGTSASRNYACYIDSLHTAYIHNPVDRGSTPLGLTLLGTSLPLSKLRYTWQRFDFSTNQIPDQSDSTLYSWMSGEAVGPIFIQECQSPTDLSDTRFLYSFGQDPSMTENSKFKEFRPGDTIKVSVALVSGDGVDYQTNNMIGNVIRAKSFYQHNYYGPVIPVSPALKITPGKKRVTLEWGPQVGPPDPFQIWDDSSKLAESLGGWRTARAPCPFLGCDDSIYMPGGRTFEGYRLYRSEDPSNNPSPSSFVLLKEFDLLGDRAGIEMCWETEEFADKSHPDPARWIQSKYVDSNLVHGKRYWYAVTSFGLPEFVTFDRLTPDGGTEKDTVFLEPVESPIKNIQSANMESYPASVRLGEVTVVPNPYYGNVYYTDGNGYEGLERDWTPDKRMIRFINLPEKATIRIFSLSGDLITTLHHDDASRTGSGLPTGQEDWHLFSESGRPIASGLFIFSVESNLGTQIGKFVIIM